MLDSIYEITRRNPAYHFWWGIRFYVTGLRALFRYPSLLAISVVPIGATIVLLIGLAFGLAWAAGEMTQVFNSVALRTTLRVIIFLLALIGGYFLYLPLARILLAPFSEALSRRAYALHRGERLVGHGGSWFGSMIEGAKLVGFQLVLVIAAIGIGIIFPPIALPIGSLLAILACSLDFYDIPLGQAADITGETRSDWTPWSTHARLWNRCLADDVCPRDKHPAAAGGRDRCDHINFRD